MAKSFSGEPEARRSAGIPACAAIILTETKASRQAAPAAEGKKIEGQENFRIFLPHNLLAASPIRVFRVFRGPKPLPLCRVSPPCPSPLAPRHLKLSNRPPKSYNAANAHGPDGCS